MGKYLFLFDLDSTITQVEILPEISKLIGAESEIRKITENTMQGIIPFKHSFISRVDILGKIDVNEVSSLVEGLPLNEELVNFIKKNRDICYIVTGNLDVWIEKLLERLDMKDHCFCSKAIVKDGKIEKVVSVLDKGKQVKQIIQPFVAVGDGDNDSEMAELAEIGIGYGAVRNIAPALLNCIDYAFYDEEKLVEFLNKLVEVEDE